MNITQRHALILLKLGVAFAFLYPAFSAFINPALWLGYIPPWIIAIIPREMFLPLFSIVEIIVAAGILFTNYFFPPLIAGLMLLSIVLFNPGEFPVIFRDLAIASAAFALAIFLKRP